MIHTEAVRAWPECMQVALGQIKEKYILLMLEDLFVAEPVDTARILKLVEWIAENSPACVRLQPASGMVPTQHQGICHLPPGIAYRSSTVLSIWRKDVLLDLLRSGESIWQFEVIGSARTDKYPDFYATQAPHIQVWNGVIRGKWVPSVLKKLQSAGLPINTVARPAFNLGDHFVQLGRELRTRILMFFPIRYRRRIRLMFTTSGATVLKKR